MKFQQIRSATAIVTFGGVRFLIDPWLGAKGSFPPIPGSPNPDLSCPLNELPLPISEILNVDAVIATHLHFDHFDSQAMEKIPKDMPIFVQDETDAETLRSKDFTDIRILKYAGEEYKGVLLIKTDCLHGQPGNIGLLYEKMRYSSIGLFDSFDAFLKGTAYDDYENLEFALICSSLPEDTTLSFTCPDCNQQFNMTVKNKDLLRTEMVNEDMKDFVAEIVEADTFVERAREVYKKAPFNQITRISVNGDKDLTVIMDLYAPSAYDAINRVFKGIPEEYHEKEDYAPYIGLVNLVKAIYIAQDEPDETGEYIYDAFEDPVEILETLVRFNEPQLNRITLYMNEAYLSHKYYYGIQNVVCPNCKHELGEYTMNMDQLLFLKLHRQ